VSETLVTFLLAIGITSFIAYIFEVILPFSEEIIQREEMCAEAGGMIYKQKNAPDLCIKREIIIIK
jgi:hypothetical protein